MRRFVTNSNKIYLSNKNNFEWPTDKIRTTYIDYFCVKNQHKFIKSSSVLPTKGAGTYFTNAGMNQFKSIILGEIEAGEIVDLSKYIGVANSQKCIRIGGKHSDLDEIGKDTYHHTFFEMLGNWSFGSYGVEKACEMGLDLLVNIYKLNINGLFFTYFGGDKALGLEPDLKTKNMWLKLGVPERQIIPFDMKANFWEMDTVGPCGPCTEIHYDRHVTTSNPYTLKESNEARNLVNKGTERVIELWNIVFMRYNRLGPSNFSNLPIQVVDTGMGLERLSAVLNNLKSNYDTDLFQPLFEHVYNCSKSKVIKPYNEYALNSELSAAYRTLVDHMRSITISISDGLVPSRNGLGGFLKYLILKCMKIGRETLKSENETELLCNLVPSIIKTLSKAYPELVLKSDYIQDVIRNTNLKQKIKLDTSLEITERYLKKLNNPIKLTGDQIWKLFKGDKSGEEISIDFIKEHCEGKKIELDMDGFYKFYIADNEKALRNMKNMRKDNSEFIELSTKFKDIPKTDNSFKYSFDLDTKTREANYKFRNYQNLLSKVLSIAVKNENGKYEFKKSTKLNDDCILILDRTNFYPESGGQISDKGLIRLVNNNGNLEVKVENVYHIRGYSFHIGKVVSVEDKDSSGNLSINDTVECLVHKNYRYNVALNHTGIHLLNHAIRNHYKNENSIIQVNSLVKNNNFRLEFKFNQSLVKPSLDDLKGIELLCNDLIKKSLPVYIENGIEYEDGDEVNYPVRKLNNILYPIKLRVVSIGTAWDKFKEKNTKFNPDYSAELCCGTHASNTSQLETFLITRFNVVGDSSFEIEATTSNNAFETKKNDQMVLEYLSEIIDIYKKNKESQNLTTIETHTNMNQMAVLQIKISEIFKHKEVSYLVMNYVKNESIKYRPSKHALQQILKKYFNEELGQNLKLASNSAVISSINPKSNLSMKFLAFNSSLDNQQVLSVIRKVEDPYPVLTIYNRQKGVYFFYSKNPIDDNKELKEYFDSAQEKILRDNANSCLLDSNKFYRIIKVSSTLNDLRLGESYFSF